MSDRLTMKQGYALAAVATHSGSSTGLRNDGWVDLPTLADYLRTSTEGLGYTLGSLVRRGLVERYKIAGRMQYRPTPLGADLDLSPHQASNARLHDPAHIARVVAALTVEVSA